MKKKILTLKNVLLTQDMGEKNADRICDEALNNALDASKDPISFILVKALEENSYDFEVMLPDINYAISQLIKAKAFIESRLKQSEAIMGSYDANGDLI